MVAKRTSRSNTNLRAAQRLNEATAQPTEGLAEQSDMDPAASTVGGDSNRQSQIAALAYCLAEQRGFAEGHELEDWLQAEQELGG